MMKRFLPSIVLVIFAVFAAAPGALAQTKTIVSATVVDPNGVPYAGGSVATQLMPTGGTPTINKVPVNVQNNPAAIDANGHFTVSLWCNTAGGACTPFDQAGTQWQFTITNPGAQPPVGFGGVSFTVNVTITGTTQDISSTLNASAVQLYRDSGAAGGGCTVSGAAGNLLYVNNATTGCTSSAKLNYNSGGDSLSITAATQSYAGTTMVLTGAGGAAAIGLNAANGIQIATSPSGAGGAISLTSTLSSITETAGTTFTQQVGNASPVTPGSVTQRVVATGTDTILGTDRTNRVVYNNTTAVAVTLPQAGSAGFAGGYNTRLSNQNTGTVTVTPTTSLINGNATLVLLEGQDCFVTPSAAGSDWAADCNEPQITAGANVLLTRGVHSLTISLTGLSPAPNTLAATANLFVNSYTQGTGNFGTAQVAGNTLAGAASTANFQLGGTWFSGGTGTTTYPALYLFCNAGTTTDVTNKSTNGTGLMFDACSGFTGNFIDAHINNAAAVFTVTSAGAVISAGSMQPTGGLASGASVNAAAASALGFTGRANFKSPIDGLLTPLNNGGNGAIIHSITTGATGSLIQVASNFTTAANTNLQAITGLTWNVPAFAENYSFSCHLVYSQATANAAVAFGIQAATNAPTNIFATGLEQITVGPPATFVTGTLATLATTTATNIVSGTPTATATNYYVDLGGTLELGASANAINIMVSTATSADAVTVLRGSSCQLF